MNCASPDNVVIDFNNIAEFVGARQAAMELVLNIIFIFFPEFAGQEF